MWIKYKKTRDRISFRSVKNSFTAKEQIDFFSRLRDVHIKEVFSVVQLFSNYILINMASTFSFMQRSTKAEESLCN